MPRLPAILLLHFTLAVAALSQTAHWHSSDRPLAKDKTSQLRLAFENCQPAGKISLPQIVDCDLQLDGSQSTVFDKVNNRITKIFLLGVKVHPTGGTHITIPSFKINTDKGKITVPAASFAVSADISATTAFSQQRFTVSPGLLAADRYIPSVSKGSTVISAPTVRWDPADGTLAKDQTTRLWLVYENCQPADKTTFPKNTGGDLQLTRTQSTHVNSIKGRTTRTFALGFNIRPAGTGRVAIPSFKINTDKGKITVPAASFVVSADISAATVPPLPNAAFAIGQSQAKTQRDFLNLQPIPVLTFNQTGATKPAMPAIAETGEYSLLSNATSASAPSFATSAKAFAELDASALPSATIGPHAPTVRWEPAGGSLVRGQPVLLQLVFENCFLRKDDTLPTTPGLELKFTSAYSSKFSSSKGRSMQTTSYAVHIYVTSNEQLITIPSFTVATDKGELTVASVDFEITDQNQDKR